MQTTPAAHGQAEAFNAATTPADASTLRPATPPSSPTRLAARRFRRHRLAMASIIFIGVLVLLAVLGPVVSPHNPNAVNPAGGRMPPSADHWLGTDSIGRDVLSRLLQGARVSLTVGIAAGLSAAGLGMMLGLVAGLLGGWIDTAIMRLVDIFLSFPSLVVILLLVAILGPSIATIIVVIALFEWPASCRIVRQMSLSVKEMDFVLAARAIGSRNLAIMYRHMVAPVLPPLTVVATFLSAGAILLESSLSFLGLGVKQPQATWGGMLQDAQSLTILQQMPWLWLSPGLAISLTVLAIAFIGDGLRDAFDPKQQL
ncbi:ABC transporter permease subunit [Phytoactinopolyspora sp. XMNu-373]|uniref:ABC transporter permease subunit n=2 Tax=Phytoactinopolyspora mesophila TaxID=2650750 RepID=A0A7K3M2K9_9ACTN|nr:ABC transporter permease subunit [Phytoactinopolyspora mesophila]